MTKARHLLIAVLVGAAVLTAAALANNRAAAARGPHPTTGTMSTAASSGHRSGDFGPCSLAALAPIKTLARPSSYMQAHAVFWCDNNLPRTCTFHVNLQQWSNYFKVWVNVHGHDSWYHACPRRLGARKEMHSVPFKCLNPEILYGFRTVVSGSVEWPNGTVENHTSTDRRFNFHC